MPALLLGSLVWPPQVGCVHALFPVKERAVESFFVRTDDHWTLALHHYPAAPGAPERAYPLLICHGITSNRHSWDLTDNLSFPRYAAGLGFDTWVVDLRAAGSSSMPDDEGQDWTFSFDDYALHDLPTAIDFVSAHSGGKQVHWVGHSMGGMLLYAYLERVGQSKVRSVAALGSPAYINDDNRYLSGSVSLLPFIRWLSEELPAGTISKLASPLAYAPFLGATHIFWNYDNITPSTASMAAANAIDNVSGPVVRQFADNLVENGFRSEDRSIDYRAGMGHITVPALFVAGALDQLAPPAAVMDAYRRIGSTDKRIAVLSRANGYSHDYGHGDLSMGNDAPREVFPMLGDWLVEHDGAGADPAGEARAAIGLTDPAMGRRHVATAASADPPAQAAD